MRFILKGPFKENIHNLIRIIGYHFQGEDKEKKELVFTRPSKGYPRFHIYSKIDGSTGPSTLNSGLKGSPQEIENLIFNLHLDQKRPIYKGVTAHSGEYEGEVVEKEVERIKKILEKL